MTRLFILLPLFWAALLHGQKNIQPTDHFVVTGAVKQEITFSLSDIKSLPSQKIKNLVITNHAGEKKGTAKKLKGVRLIDLLQKVQIAEENPRLLSTYYLVLEASDGYKVVYSWNEIFNTPAGKQIFILTEKDGENIDTMKDRIVIITPGDIQTGRRYVKGLAKVTFLVMSYK